MNRRPLRAAAAAALFLGLALAGCGGGDDAATDATTTSTTEEATTTTTEAEASTTTTEAEEASTTTTTSEGEEATTTTIDTSVADAWGATAVEFREEANGTTHEFSCPPGGPVRDVWGSSPFTDDSSVCNAAVFTGAITRDGGGNLLIEIAGPQDEYIGAEANGVTTFDYPEWPGSFIVLTGD